MNEMKNAIDGFNSWLNQVKERICELEDRSLDIIQSEEYKEIRMKRIKERLCEL